MPGFLLSDGRSSLMVTIAAQWCGSHADSPYSVGSERVAKSAVVAGREEIQGA